MLYGVQNNLATERKMLEHKKNKCKNVSTSDLNFHSLYPELVKFCKCKSLYSVRFNFVCMSVVLLCFLQLVNLTSGSIMGEECDWTGSGLQPISSGGRGVTPVYLRCSQGVVEWNYPRGALRVLLRLGSTGRDFRGCIKVNPAFSGARMFLEGPRSLSLLFSTEDGADSQLVRCFRSKHGQAAIYVESELAEGSANVFPKQIAEFEYDLEPLSKQPSGDSYDITDDCRPCSNEELTQAFCTSDIVAKGSISLIENKYELEVSQVSVAVSKFLRKPIFSSDAEEEEEESENSVGGRRDLGLERTKKVQVFVPTHCKIKPTDGGSFVFMARKKLGNYKLICAPRLKEWQDLIKTESVKNGAHCVLRS